MNQIPKWKWSPQRAERYAARLQTLFGRCLINAHSRRKACLRKWGSDGIKFPFFPVTRVGGGVSGR